VGISGLQAGEDVNKGPDRYVLLYTAATRAEALRTLGRWASEPELDFTWYDAVTLSQRIREEMDL